MADSVMRHGDTEHRAGGIGAERAVVDLGGSLGVKVMAKKKHGSSTIVVNRRARYDYDIDSTVECGMVLTGTEVKSLRTGKASLQHAFATVRGGELWLAQAHIPHYEFGNIANHEPTRMRKLLARRREIDEMERFSQEQGRTLVPMKMYWSDGRAKLLVGLGRGKAVHDKRRAKASQDAQRQIDRALAARQRG